MIDIDALGAAVVGLIQSIPEVVSACNGDKSNVSYYVDQYPDDSSLLRAVYRMKPGEVLLAWKGTFPAQRGTTLLWKHRFGLYWRPPNQPQAPVSAAALWRLIIRGVPTGGSLSFLNSSPIDTVEPMDVPTAQRVINEEGQDVFQSDLVYPEIGDQ